MRLAARVLLATALACLLAASAFAADDKLVVERRSVTVEGRALAYRSTAGMLNVGEAPVARMFFTAYELEDGDAGRRPIAFVFNGGPGAASAYLHLGALGPRRVVLNDDGSFPPPPSRLADNESSWLGFTDLVFVDPVGTGFSRAQGKRGKDDKDKDEDNDGSSFFGTREDADTMARFIRLYLTRNGRWLSPKFLVGESYGGFRVATLLELLPSSYAMQLNGAVLISPALQFSIIRADSFNAIPPVLKLPSLVAVAAQHGKSSLPRPAGGVDRALLAPVEAWSLDTYLPGLARGGALAPAAAQALVAKLAAWTGLPAETIARDHGRIGAGDFAKQLLRGSGRITGLYDGAITTPDPDPDSATPQRGDIMLDQLNAVLLPAFNAYVRDELKYETDQPYLLLNPEVQPQWRWRPGRGQGYAGAADQLKQGMTLNPQLKLMVAHGLFDLITPYFVSVYVLDQLYLAPELKRNLTITTYPAGHMLYTHAASRAALYRDAKALFGAAIRAD